MNWIVFYPLREVVSWHCKRCNCSRILNTQWNGNCFEKSRVNFCDLNCQGSKKLPWIMGRFEKSRFHSICLFVCLSFFMSWTSSLTCKVVIYVFLKCSVALVRYYFLTRLRRCFFFPQELYSAAHNVARELLNTERTYALLWCLPDCLSSPSIFLLSDIRHWFILYQFVNQQVCQRSWSHNHCK